MSYFPYRKLFIGPQYAIAVAGNFFQIVCRTSGSLLARQNACPGVISAADVSWLLGKFVTTGDDKLLRVWAFKQDAEGNLAIELESSLEIPKKSSEIHITSDGQTILASDKFGDIYTYPMIAPSESPAPTTTQGGKEGEKPRHGELILGHTSVITSFLLDPDDEFVISGDRDEHIRISWFPMGYNIERFCMGHRKYVSALHIPAFSKSSLLSGGGDSDIFVWDWTTGQLLHRVPIMDDVTSLRKVKGGRRTFVRYPRRPDGQGLSRKSRRSRAKIRAQAQAAAGKVVEPDDDRPEEGGASDDGDENVEDVEMDDGTTPDPASTNTPTPQDVQLPHKFDPTAESFVVGKIGSIQVEAGGLVLFTVVGASGLFYFSLPQGSTSMIATPSVCAIDLGLPVLDFVVSTDNTPSLWVSVDGNWKGTDTESGEPKPMVRLLRWRDGQLVEDSDPSVGLLRGLNSNLVEGPVEMVSSLELYAQLAWLPKSREEEAEDNGETMGEEEARAASATPDIDDTNDTSPSVLTGNNGKKPVKKLAGRLKTRERLSKHHQGAGMKDESPVPKAGIEVEDLQVKKPKLSEDGKEESGPSVA